MINHDYFSVIDMPEKAYWLGFMYADGNITRQQNGRKVVSFAQKDRAVLEKFQTALSCGYAIGRCTKYSSRHDKTYEWFRVCIYSDKLFDDLHRQGCIETKSLVLSVPNPALEFPSHFIRGYNDGDGGVYFSQNYPRIRMRGTETLLNWIANTLPGKCSIHPKGPTTQLFSQGWTNAIANLHYIYKDAAVYKDDKHKTAMDILNVVRTK